MPSRSLQRERMPGPERRPPACAGTFYPGTADELDRALDALLADCAFTAGQLATFDRERTRLITRRRGWQDRYSWKFWVKWKPVLPGIGPYEDWPDWDKARKKKVNAGYGED